MLEQAKVSCCMFLPTLSYKTICSWLLLGLDLKMPRRGQAVTDSQLMLVLGLGPLHKRNEEH